jgi:hypothetical protein
MPLGVEAINEDVFDLDELAEEELEQLEGAAGSAAASVASSAFYSAIREVSLGIRNGTYFRINMLLFNLPCLSCGYTSFESL